MLIEDIMERVERSSSSIHLVLKKALSEPWPYCFNELEKWNVEEFPPISIDSSSRSRTNGRQLAHVFRTQTEIKLRI